MRWLLLGGLGVLLAMNATAQPPEGRRRGGNALERGGQRPACEQMRNGGRDAVGGREAVDGKRGRDGHRPPPPVVVALDQDRDGVLSASEIDAAATALRTLDRNGDGVVDQRELRPPRGMRGDQDGRGGRGDRAGRGGRDRGGRQAVTPPRSGADVPVDVEPGDTVRDD